MLRSFVPLLMASSLVCSPVFAATSAYGTLSIDHTQHPPVIDGELNDSAWQHAKEIALSYEVSPGENTAAPVTTQAKLLEDGEYLYIAFDARDTAPEQIRAYLRDRDKAWSDDMVGIKIDTYNDGNKAYQFFVNPYGVQQDAIENELTGRESDAWDAIWNAEGQLTPGGYQVEMAIPLRVLNFNAGDDIQKWGIELVRFFPRLERHRLSNAPRDRNLSCTLCQMTLATGIKNAKQERQLQWVPTLTAARHEDRDPEEGNDWQSDSQQDVGLDIKWGITPDLSLYTTINPDFSQIESDSGQLSINNNFSLFNDEKRGFFLDNADFFETPFQNLVYTRNIVAPVVGSKLTGRQGDHTFGLMASLDEETTFVIPGNQASSVANLEQESTSSALRYRYDIGNTFSLGTLLTGRFSDDYHNILAGIDAKYRLSDTDTFTAQVVSTNTQYPQWLSDSFKDESTVDDAPLLTDNESSLRTADSDDFWGSSVHMSYEHKERDWHSKVHYRRKSDGFRSDLGFVNQVDADKLVLAAGRYFYQEDDWWNKLHLYSDWDISYNNEGELLEKEIEGRGKLFARYQSILELGFYGRERAVRLDESQLTLKNNAELFTEKGLKTYLEAVPISGLNMNLFVRGGDEVDHANKQLGQALQIRPRISWNINKHLLLKLNHTYRTLDVDGGRLYTANLTDMRLVWQFNVRSFLRINAVHKDISRNPALYLSDDVDSEYRSLTTQLLYSYKLNPQTLVFLGYADNGYQDDNFDSLQKDQRSLFMKFSYAWL